MSLTTDRLGRANSKRGHKAEASAAAVMTGASPSGAQGPGGASASASQRQREDIMNLEHIRARCIRVYDLRLESHIVDISGMQDAKLIREKIFTKFNVALNDENDPYELYIEQQTLKTDRFVRDSSIDDLTLMEICLNPDHPYRAHLILDKKRHKKAAPRQKSPGAKSAKSEASKKSAKSKHKHDGKAFADISSADVSADVDDPATTVDANEPSQSGDADNVTSPHRKQEAKGTRTFQKLTSFFGETVPTPPPAKLVNFFGEENLSKKQRPRRKSATSKAVGPEMASGSKQASSASKGNNQKHPPPIPNRRSSQNMFSKTLLDLGVLPSDPLTDPLTDPADIDARRIESFFGDRPPQELIAENLEKFFPGILKVQVDTRAAHESAVSLAGASAPVASLPTSSTVASIAGVAAGSPGALAEIPKSLPAFVKETVTLQRTSRLQVQQEHQKAMYKKLLSSNLDMSAGNGSNLDHTGDSEFSVHGHTDLSATMGHSSLPRLGGQKYRAASVLGMESHTGSLRQMSTHTVASASSGNLSGMLRAKGASASSAALSSLEEPGRKKKNGSLKRSQGSSTSLALANRSVDAFKRVETQSTGVGLTLSRSGTVGHSSVDSIENKLAEDDISIASNNEVDSTAYPLHPSESYADYQRAFEVNPDTPRSVKWVKGALIGAGSFGKVYYGVNCDTGEIMAVKQVQIRSAVSQANRARNNNNNNNGTTEGGNGAYPSSHASPHHPTQDEAAVKARRRMLEALHREISLLKDLTHVNIVRYLGFDVEENCINVFLEYVSGGSVASALAVMGSFE
eukprot:jgi/Hompol1/1926/HPOL_005102-RA